MMKIHWGLNLRDSFEAWDCHTDKLEMINPKRCVVAHRIYGIQLGPWFIGLSKQQLEPREQPHESKKSD